MGLRGAILIAAVLVTFSYCSPQLDFVSAGAKSDSTGSNSDTESPSNSSSYVLANTVQRLGVTWTFGRPVRVGKYINGDYWVMSDDLSDPTIPVIGISPASVTVGGRTVNGSEINRDVRSPNQGFDSNISSYNESLNVGLGVSPSTPLILNPASQQDNILSLLSSRSEINGHPLHLARVAILTVLLPTPSNLVPAADAFRPYWGRGNSGFPISKVKAAHSQGSNLNRFLFTVPGLPPIYDGDQNIFYQNVLGQFPPQLVLREQWGNSSYGQSLDLPFTLNVNAAVAPDRSAGYGRETSTQVARALLVLMSSAAPSIKQELFIDLVQEGLDLLSAGRGVRGANGGHVQGRKILATMASVFFESDPVLGAWARSSIANDAFSEDWQFKWRPRAGFEFGEFGFRKNDDYLDPFNNPTGNNNANIFRLGSTLEQHLWWATAPFSEFGTQTTWGSYVACCTINAGAGIFAAYLKAIGGRNAWQTSVHQGRYFDFVHNFIAHGLTQPSGYSPVWIFFDSRLLQHYLHLVNVYGPVNQQVATDPI